MIRAVYFDAVGTVIHPERPVAEMYRHVAFEFGCDMPPGELKRRMADEYAVQEAIDSAADWRTSEGREFERWSAIVKGTFRESPQRGTIFRGLHLGFSLPAAWRISSNVAPALKLLTDRNLPVGLASNFDGRLRGLVATMPELQPFRDRLLISSEIGHRKPGLRFFEAVITNAGVEPHEILFVGDDLRNDITAARAMGMIALHVLPGDPEMAAGIAALLGAGGMV